jgi:hypothetical protein
MRIVLGLLAIAAIAVGGAVYYLSSNLDSLVKNAIETYGSEITGTRVRVSSVKITLAEGKGRILGLRVGNPAGFSKGDALRLDELVLDIDLDPFTISQGPYVVSVVRIIAPEVNAEVNATGGTNILAIQKNVESYSQSGGGGASSEPAGEASASAPRMRIDKLVFEKAHLAADTTALGGKPFDLALPPLRMEKLGGSAGAPADAIAQEVLDAYTNVVAKAIARALAQNELDGVIDDKVGGAGGEALKGALRGLLE